MGELYERHVYALLRFAVRVVGAADAEDIVQSTFVRAARVAATYDDRAGSGRPWLLGIAARLVQERRRSLSRWARVLIRLGAEGAGRAALPDLHADIEKGLRGLTEAKRTVLVLAEIEGFGCDEIARMLDVPVGTVWTRLHHARRELRKYYEEGS
jgi:RNA polymerase sigma-70 factor (ECF subfamily)